MNWFSITHWFAYWLLTTPAAVDQDKVEKFLETTPDRAIVRPIVAVGKHLGVVKAGKTWPGQIGYDRRERFEDSARDPTVYSAWAEEVVEMRARYKEGRR